MEKEKWFFKTSVLVIALLSVGPFALPLFWLNPRFTIKRKALVSIIVIVLTYIFSVMLMQGITYLKNSYQILQ